MELLICTHNEHKVDEIAGFLQGYKLRSFKDLADFTPPEETSLLFQGNALIKAAAGFRASGLPSLADDSGLEVLALGGKPGVFSARYAGEGAGDRANNEKLLKELRGIKDRRARFVSALALVDGKKTIVVTGTVEGVILEEPRGEGGFGYDPLLYVPELGKTMAELTLTEKNRISHRGRALVKLATKLKGI